MSTDVTRQTAIDAYVLPTSFAQQRLWFLDQLNPGLAVYNLSEAVRWSGPLEPEHLETAWNLVMERHETLRTRLASIDGEPMQIVEPLRRRQLPVVDLSDLPPERRMAEAARRAATEAAAPFDLARGPLHRATLFRLAPDDHVLLASFHHAVCDGWSLDVFFHELAAAENALSRGEMPSLPELAIQYADYAVWQRETLSGAELERE